MRTIITMNLSHYSVLRDILLAKPGAAEAYPFGPDTLVPKVGGKMFGLLYEEEGIARISLKCDPEHGELLRATHPSIIPGYHLNKRHWITIIVDGSIPDDLMRDLIDESYDLVVKGLPRAVRNELIG